MLFECLTALFAIKNISSSNNFYLKPLLLIALSLIPLTTCANIQLSSIYTNRMVSQRDMPIKVWGRADSGEEITISFKGVDYKTRAGQEGNELV